MYILFLFNSNSWLIPGSIIALILLGYALYSFFAKKKHFRRIENITQAELDDFVTQAEKSGDKHYYFLKNLKKSENNFSNVLTYVFEYCQCPYSHNTKRKDLPLLDVPDFISNDDLMRITTSYKMSGFHDSAGRFLLDQFLKRGLTADQFLICRNTNLNQLCDAATYLNKKSLKINSKTIPAILQLIDANIGKYIHSIEPIIQLLLHSECNLKDHYEKNKNNIFGLNVLLVYIKNDMLEAFEVNDAILLLQRSMRYVQYRVDAELINEILLVAKNLPDRIGLMNYYLNRLNLITLKGDKLKFRR